MRANSSVPATTADKCGSEEPKTPEASPENIDNQRPRRAATVSPTSNIHRCDNDTMSKTFENNQRTKHEVVISPAIGVSWSGPEKRDSQRSPGAGLNFGLSDCELGRTTFRDDDEEVKPISLDDFEKATVISSDQMIDIELIIQLSLQKDCLDKNGKVAAKRDNIVMSGSSREHEKIQIDACNEQDWTKNIATVTEDCNGNPIEYLEYDESSTSSMTTIIDSEQSTTESALEDLEHTFRSDEETDEVQSDDTHDVCRCCVDPLHSSCFAIFGGECGCRKMNNKDKTNETAGFKIKRPNTSNINPMTGEKSLTDDIEEWKINVLSSWTLTPPKKKRKYKKKQYKRATGEHCYSLRCRTEKKKDIAAILQSYTQNPIRKKCRELKNIAPFNLPGISEIHREESANSASQTSKDIRKREPMDPVGSECSAECRSESQNSTEIKTMVRSKVLRKRGKNGASISSSSKRKKKKANSREKSCVAKRRQQQIKRWQAIPKSTKVSVKRKKKESDGALNIDQICIGSTRIAKKFIFNPLRIKGKDKTKIFFGTVSGKHFDKKPDGTCIDMWHIVYDDGDEEYLGNVELKETLKLYEYAKGRDKRPRDRVQYLSRSSKAEQKNDTKQSTMTLKAHRRRKRPQELRQQT